MKKFITLPGGEIVRADIITAIRKGEGETTNTGYIFYPRVIIDFGSAHTNSIVYDCKTNKERDEAMSNIARQLYPTPLKSNLLIKAAIFKCKVKIAWVYVRLVGLLKYILKLPITQKIKSSLSWLEGRR